MQEKISFSEVIDELWGVYLKVGKGVFVALTSILHTLAVILLFLAQQIFGATLWAKRYVEKYQPIRPAIFDFTPKQERP
jgi:hypothetical protein